MSTSKTDIANLALQKIGVSPINSIDDEGSKPARTCKQNYDHARRVTLMKAQWKFAKKLVGLSKDAAAPAWKWQASYTLPVDHLKLVEIEGENVWEPKEYFDVQQGKLMLYLDTASDAPADTVNIEYIFDQQDTTTFDPLYVDALAYQLAALIARPLTGSDSKEQELIEMFTTLALPSAQEHNGHQTVTDNNNPIMRIMADSYLRKARRTSYGSSTGLDR